MLPPEYKYTFESILQAHCDQDLLYHSRIHPLPTFSRKGQEVWVKREDESGFGISGAKKRKYASLLPHLKSQGIQKVILIGGSRSNNVAGLLQLLNENRIGHLLFLKREHERVLSGNRLLLSLLTGEDQIRWVEKEDWKDVEELAQREADKRGYFVIPEGGTCQPAFAGACSLGLDVLKHEKAWDHIWVDSGTALMAGAVIEVMALFSPEVKVHVVQMAGNEAYFERQLKKFHGWMEELTGKNLSFPSNYCLHRPLVGKSFGSVGRSVLDSVKQLAREEGIISDPIYSGKLFMTAKAKLQEASLPGRHLVVHSGGGVGLMGYSFD